MLGSSGAFGWIFWGLWVLNLKMFVICGPLGPYKCRRFGIYFSRAPGGDHSGAGGLLRFKIQQGDANLRRRHEPVRPERLLPGRQRGPLLAAERAHWPMARGGHCQLRVFVPRPCAPISLRDLFLAIWVKWLKTPNITHSV
jgi:hypothetical protein